MNNYFIYQQSSGRFVSPDGCLIGVGYAGNGAGLNNPAMEQVSKAGPLPCGRYRISRPANDAHVGHFAMALVPDAANEMFGRSAFFIHGDNPQCNHTASEGCIVLALVFREAIASSDVAELLVVA